MTVKDTKEVQPDLQVVTVISLVLIGNCESECVSAMRNCKCNPVLQVLTGNQITGEQCSLVSHCS